MGDFNINLLQAETACPLCGVFLDNVANCYLYNCAFQVEALEAGSKKKELKDGKTGPNESITFIQDANEDKKYAHLKITTFEL